MKNSKVSAIVQPRRSVTFLVVCLALTASATRAGEWTRLRGPNGQGISDAKTIPVKWTQEDYNWKVKLPGTGHSSPVTWRDKVFVTCWDKEKKTGILLALGASNGEKLWQKEYALKSFRINRRNSYAAATPTVDSDRVYVLWPTADDVLLEALNHDGEGVWERHFEGVKSQHGPGCSPIVAEDMVVFAHERSNREKNAKSAWIAVDRTTGVTRWVLEREKSDKISYSTPCLYRPDYGGPELVFTSFAHGLTGVDPGNGKVIWEAKSALIARVVSSPVIAGDALIGTCGQASSGKRLIAIRPQKKDNSIVPAEAYRIDGNTTPYVPTSLAHGGLLFTFHDQGYVSCLRGDSGEQLWREKPAGRYYGSPVWVDGKIYCITIEGDVVVLKAAPEYELLAVNPLGETSHATPAVAGGKMYLRTLSQLFCIGGE
ncbi:MAG: PQQ-binding-like beta-propeller repeat protein [Phycisphaerales bacterium]|nr:MAG: PQQ-binding-like beta-propeller repeat protein [Phycisphaerales bacterium]